MDDDEFELTEDGMQEARRLLQKLSEDMKRQEVEAINSVNKSDYRCFPTFLLMRAIVPFTRTYYISSVMEEFVSALTTEIESLEGMIAEKKAQLERDKKCKCNIYECDPCNHWKHDECGVQCRGI